MYARNVFIVSFLFCFQSPALAQALIRAPGASFTEFFAYSNTESLKTYAEHQMDQILKSPRPAILKSLLEKSQRDFLSPEPLEAKKHYKKIISLIHSFDWTQPERKIILYALFRMAQLEQNLQKQKLFLQEALVFGRNLKIDSSLFPPPIMHNYSKLKKSAGYTLVDLKKIFPLHEIILINGQRHSFKEKLKLAYGVYRISALSSSHKSWTEVVSLSRLMAQKIKTPALLAKKSSCEKARFQNPDLKKHQVLFPNFCVFKETLAENELVNLKIQNSLAEEPLLPAEKKLSPWIAGTGIALISLTAFLILKKNNKDKAKDKKNTQKPTFKIGF